MGSSALAGRTGVDFARGDRIDVTDSAGVRIGWVDPRTGVRNLLAPERRAEFDQMIDYWLSAAGLSSPESLDDVVNIDNIADVDANLAAGESAAQQHASANTHEPHQAMHIREVRYPDAEVVRSLLIPLRQLT